MIDTLYGVDKKGRPGKVKIDAGAMVRIYKKSGGSRVLNAGTLDADTLGVDGMASGMSQMQTGPIRWANIERIEFWYKRMNDVYFSQIKPVPDSATGRRDLSANLPANR